MAADLPTGVVTFLMTDVVGSTAIWRDSPEAAAVMARQAELVGDAMAKHGGARPADQGEGDSILAAFARPRDALAAACDAQRALVAERWPEGVTLRVRTALYTGDAELRDDRNYGGRALIRCARLRSLASGGQVLVSSATALLAAERLPEGAGLIELETVAIPDFAGPERVYQLCHPEFPGGLAPLRRAVGRIPVWSTPLVGREAEQCALAALFEEERLITVTGAGGSGKTRLAHALAEALRDRFADGVAWVELDRVADPAQVVGAVLVACGAPEVPGVPPLDVLARHLASADQLVVLDNCEHLLAASAEVADVALRAGGRVRVLATSREPLGVAAETSWRIPSLSLPATDEGDPERLLDSDAAALFVGRARAARSDFRLGASEAPYVARICRRLDGIPLAIELAAARVRALPLERLAGALDDRFRVLTGGARTALERQRTLLASVEWSHDLLDEEERTLFRRLALFTAPFSVEAAEAVAADEDIAAHSVLELLARLVEKSLVVLLGDRYRLLETIQSYARERAADASELKVLRDRHLAWFRLRARGWRLDRDIASRAVLDEVFAEAPDLIAAAEWAGAREERLPSEILHALAQHWEAPEMLREAGSVGPRLLATLPEGSRAWLEGLAPLARSLWQAGEADALAEAVQEATATHGSALDPVVRGFLDAALTIAGADAGHEGAHETLRQAGETGREVGNAYLELLAKLELGMAFLRTGNLAAARPLLTWAERATSPGTWPCALLLNAKVVLGLHRGDLSSTLRAVERELGERTIDSLHIAAQSAFLRCDADAMAQWIGELEPFRDVYFWGAVVEQLRGQLALLRDDLLAAAAHLDRALAALPAGRGLTLYVGSFRAQLALALGDDASAEAFVSASEARVRGGRLPLAAGRLAIVAAHLARHRGDLLEAESRAQAGLALATQQGILQTQMDALEVLALLAEDRDDLERAARLAGAARAFRERSGHRWREHLYRDAFDALEARLPEAALDEGATLSLDEAAAYAARGRGQRGRPDHGWASLTPSEARVVELVAEGLANAAIAKRLFVSLATVKTHLVHVYEKLGLATRAELIAAATKRRLEIGSEGAGGSS